MIINWSIVIGETCDLGCLLWSSFISNCRSNSVNLMPWKLRRTRWTSMLSSRPSPRSQPPLRAKTDHQILSQLFHIITSNIYSFIGVFCQSWFNEKVKPFFFGRYIIHKIFCYLATPPWLIHILKYEFASCPNT